MPSKRPQTRSAGNARQQFRLNDSIPYLIYRISTKANQNIHEKLRPAGITLTKWRLLSSLESRGTSTIGELADCTVMKHAVVSRNLTEMEKDGLVRRLQLVADQRVVHVRLTRKGHALFEKAYEIAEAHLNTALKGFTPADTAVFLSFLRIIQRNVGIRG